MKHTAFTFLLCTMVVAPAFAKSAAEYKKDWCPKHNGEIDYITLKENWCPKCGRSCSCPTSRPATQEEQDSIKIPEGDLIDG